MVTGTIPIVDDADCSHVAKNISMNTIEERESVLKDALERLKGSAGQAVSTMVALMDSDQETVRERAAGRILDYLLKVKEVESLRARVEALERKIEERIWTGHKA